MSDFQEFKFQFGELVVNTKTKDSYVSVSGYARMSGKHKTTISRRIQVDTKDLVTTIIITSGGTQKVVLIPIVKVLNFLGLDKPNLIKDVIEAVKELTNQNLKIPFIFPKKSQEPNKKTKKEYKKIKAPKILSPNNSRKRSTEGYIYLFETENLIKLGFSTRPQQRIKDLERWEGELKIVFTIKGTEGREKELHALLHQTGEHLGSEWYSVSRKEEVLNLLKKEHLGTDNTKTPATCIQNVPSL